ncbi:hypothetical protein [Rahnella sp. AN3-3W3]|uniref:hypothetical protein n=1 Tax=Rahnella sp. AN3-3W3 TaxID=1610578 RepID=UPI000DD41EDC|nr:hypothetical protein [Rahnella sp. AN3-3W3]
MITMPIPPAELYQAMASASAKAATAAGNAMNSVQQGFLSCVTKVYNSLVTMKDAVVAGFHRLSERMSPSTAEAPASTSPVSTPPVTTLNPISGADTRIFCQELIRKMEADPSSINGMFRQSPTIKLSEFNQRLTDQTAFLDAIKTNEINNVEASFLIKKWMGETLAENKFSPEERRALVANKDNKAEVNKIFENKFNSSDANARENKDKFISLLSAMRSYKEISLANINMESRQHDPSVVGIMGIAQTFDLDVNLMLATTPAEIAMRNKEKDEALTAFTALLDHCPPGVPPKPVFMRSC